MRKVSVVLLATALFISSTNSQAVETSTATKSQYESALTEDPDKNGCDSRNDILKRDLTKVIFKEGTNNCKVIAGTLLDPYSNKLIDFDISKSSSTIDIDHVVALSNAWQTGAFQLTLDQRTNFANDPLNLLAVDFKLNRQKGDGDAATWLPPYKSYRCTYVARQVAVKTKYKLWVTAPEKGAISNLLTACIK
ncbi:MAG: HNH endonuclease [Actinobacteria bacterium]|nr:HNH endonuclease [Actinomycetota bacterium]